MKKIVHVSDIHFGKADEVVAGELFEKVNELSPKDRDVAMVFQNYALYPHMSIHDNIAFPLKMRKKSNRSFLKTKLFKMLILSTFFMRIC